LSVVVFEVLCDDELRHLLSKTTVRLLHLPHARVEPNAVSVHGRQPELVRRSVYVCHRNFSLLYLFITWMATNKTSCL
jgi:hypothetical protein